MSANGALCTPRAPRRAAAPIMHDSSASAASIRARCRARSCAPAPRRGAVRPTAAPAPPARGRRHRAVAESHRADAVGAAARALTSRPARALTSRASCPSTCRRAVSPCRAVSAKRRFSLVELVDLEAHARSFHDDRGRRVRPGGGLLRRRRKCLGYPEGNRQRPPSTNALPMGPLASQRSRQPDRGVTPTFCVD